jgi:hypothetical protein
MSLESPRRSIEDLNLKEAITSIESLNAGSEQRAQLILVRLGLKPAAELALYPWNSSPEEAETLLAKSNLTYLRRESNRQQKTVAEYAVSKDEEIAKKLINCDSSAGYGALMGYPSTAIEAFENREVYLGPLPDDVKNSIFKMAFSKDHFQDEFETVRKWNTALSEYAPKLTQEYADKTLTHTKRPT